MHSTGFTVGFAAAVCFVCAIFVSSSAVLLADKQAENKILDRRSKVLDVEGLLKGSPSPAEVNKLYDENIEPVVIDLKTGEPAEGIDATTFDQQKAMSDPDTSTTAPENPAKVRRLPNHALVYQVKENGQVSSIIIPVEGKGLWSTLYGFLALDDDAQTIEGITFYQHGETPGLGGEVDNPRWKALWKGRKAYGDNGEPEIHVIKGQAPPPDKAPYEVDGLSGATLTSRGVTHLVQFWLGDNGYGPYLDKFRATAGL